MSFESIFEKPFTPVKDMSKDDLVKELEQWRSIWTWQEEVVTYWLTRITSAIKVQLRNFQFIDGTLGQPHFELKSIDVHTTERIYNYVRGEATYETKTVTIPIGSLANVAFVHGREVVAEKMDGSAPDEIGNTIEEVLK